MEVLLDINGKLRCPITFDLLGHWFIVNNVTYYTFNAISLY